MNARGMPRPQVVTFTGIVILILAGFHAVQAVSEFTDQLWQLDRTGGLFADDLWVWGVIDAVLAVVLGVAGFDILRGGEFGRIVGLAVVAVLAIRWILWMQLAPILGVAMIVLAGVMLWALTAEPAYFRKSEPEEHSG